MAGESIFEKLISKFPTEFSVLDIGAGGLEGENTSNALVDRFPDYLGMNSGQDHPVPYNLIRPNAKVIESDFYTHEFNKGFDLIVLDLNIVNNVKQDWEGDGIRHKVYNLLNDGGHVICYIMTTTEYGDALDRQMLKDHHQAFWGSRAVTQVDMARTITRLFPMYYLEEIAQEVRRPYIHWADMRKL